jgi:hypothetical protein
LRNKISTAAAGPHAGVATHSYKWSALVIIAIVDQEGHQTKTLEWLPAEQLTPVKV